MDECMHACKWTSACVRRMPAAREAPAATRPNTRQAPAPVQSKECRANVWWREKTSSDAGEH
eukprot:6195133-Pleurochrysis_carterae.AAC.1